LVVPIASKRRHGHVSKATFGKITGALARHGIELLAESKDHGAAVPCWRRWLLSQRLPRLERLAPFTLANRQGKVVLFG